MELFSGYAQTVAGKKIELGTFIASPSKAEGVAFTRAMALWPEVVSDIGQRQDPVKKVVVFPVNARG